MSRNAIAVLLGCLVLSSSLIPSSTRANIFSVSEFGINSHIASRYNNYDVMNWPADVIAGSGAGWAREDFHWFWIEPERGRFQWDYYDRMVDLLVARGTNIIGVLGHPPGWGTLDPEDDDSPLSFSPPDPERFADFATAVVKRYRGRVLHWEIWNEPDNPQFWKPQPDPVAYARLLSVVYPSIKNEVPEANILIGGLNPFDGHYLQTIAEIGAWWTFDIINVHPYVDPAMPEENGEIGSSAMSNVRRIMDRFGEKPVWVTEYGWSSRPTQRDPTGSINEEEQASFLVRGAVLLRAAGAQRVLWYSIKDEVNNGYGMLRFGRAYDDYSQPRPAYTAFTVLNNQLAGAQFERYLNEIIVTGDARVYALRFVKDGQRVDILWSLTPTKIELPTDARGATVINRNGDQWWVDAAQRKLTLYPDTSPLYIYQQK